MGLAHAGLGRKLVNGINATMEAALPPFLAEWRLKLITELRTNASGCLKHKFPSLANSVPFDFPELATINLYLHPSTSEHDNVQHPSLVPIQGLDLARLSRFTESHFIWGEPAGIFRHFATSVFPGLAMRQLMSAAISSDLGLSHRPCSILDTVINLRRESQSSEPHVPEVRVNLIISTQILNAIFDGRRTGAVVDRADLPRCRAWLPVAVIELVQPELLMAYAHRNTGM